MNAQQQAAIRKEVEADIRAKSPDLAGDAFTQAVQSGVKERLSQAKPVSVAVTKDSAPATTVAKTSVTKSKAIVKKDDKPVTPDGWKPVDNSHGTDAALRYSRRARTSGHVINIWDSNHKDTPPNIKAVKGDGRYVVIDTVSGATARANQWNMAYTLSREIDGTKVPETVKYLTPWQKAIAKASAGGKA